jgi:hypothetical protein
MGTRLQNFKFFLILMRTVFLELSEVLLSVWARLRISSSANELGNLAPLAPVFYEGISKSIVFASCPSAVVFTVSSNFVVFFIGSIFSQNLILFGFKDSLRKCLTSNFLRSGIRGVGFLTWILFTGQILDDNSVKAEVINLVELYMIFVLH